MKTIFSMMFLIGLASTSFAQENSLEKLSCSGTVYEKDAKDSSQDQIILSGVSDSLISLVTENGKGREFDLFLVSPKKPRPNPIGEFVYKFDVWVEEYHELGKVGSAELRLQKIRSNPDRISLTLVSPEDGQKKTFTGDLTCQ